MTDNETVRSTEKGVLGREPKRTKVKGRIKIGRVPD